MNPHLKIQCPRLSGVYSSLEMEPVTWLEDSLLCGCSFSRVLGMRPSYSLPFGRQEAFCHWLGLHVSVAYFFDQWG